MEEMINPLFVVPAGPELLIVLGIVVLLFGANKIPELARSVGQATGELQKGKAETERELEEMREETASKSIDGGSDGS